MLPPPLPWPRSAQVGAEVVRGSRGGHRRVDPTLACPFALSCELTVVLAPPIVTHSDVVGLNLKP